MSNQAPYVPWRPKSYPTQTFEHQPSSVNLKRFPEDEKLSLLPSTIRAVQDSNSSKSGRTLVICLDGTGDQFDCDNSNVVNFVSCLKKDDPSQLTYYQTGIGTYNGKGLSKGFSAAIDMAVSSPFPIARFSDV